MHLIPVILCGGAGSRLWPVSRETHPKPFIRLQDGLSLLQKAFLRAAALPGVFEILTVTNRELFFKIEDEFQELNHQQITTSYILEPLGRNTAPAIAASALLVSKMHNEDALLLVLAADHLIDDQYLFQQAVSEAITLAKQNQLVTFGIPPTSPSTGYGYIETDGHNVLRFIEKPNLEKAQEYVTSGNYLWNSGMFLFSAKTMLHQLAEHCPDILQATEACIQQSRQAVGKNFVQLELDAATFARVPENSIDYAVMEKSKQIAVVSSNMPWNDIGSWSALDELAKADEQGNCVDGEALLYDTANCYIQSRERLVSAVGVSNLIIVDTPDAVLVADKSRAQDVKHVYAQLKAKGHSAHKIHRTVHRPWGTFTVLEESSRFKIKRIVVKPGASLSLQMHHHRSEHWIVVSGIAKVTNGDEVFFVNTNQSTYIPAGNKHRLENSGMLDLVMIEVQSGDYLGEDDIVRLEDSYGRVPTVA